MTKLETFVAAVTIYSALSLALALIVGEIICFCDAKEREKNES